MKSRACGCVYLLVLLLTPAARGAGRSRYVGDLCTSSGGVEGICRSIGQCPRAQEQLQGGSSPTLCSYDDFTPIVCCPGVSVSSRMCKKYGDAVYRYTSDLNSYPTGETVVNQCNMKKVPFIIGGSKASPNEYPHMALLGFGTNRQNLEWLCGGSLISDRFVVTAAHCIITVQGPPKVVRLGELDLSTTEDSKHEDFEVVESLTHPDYVDGVLYNDIGLLKLNRPVVFTASIRPACVHPVNEIQDKLGIACGWGIIDWATKQPSEHLMKVNLHLLQNDVCNASYKTQATTFRLRNGIVEDSMICGGSPEGGKDTCRGDSGGPLQVKLSSPYCMYSLIGITSFGKLECGVTTAPAVYTRVSHFVSWIESVVWPNQK